MYSGKNIRQQKLDGIVKPFNLELDQTNRWIRMSQLMPWEEIEEKYAETFVNERNDGRRAKTAREAFGALLVQQMLGLSDRETVEMIQENVYIQYFLGYHEFRRTRPFDASSMVHFRKRINLEMMSAINETLRQKMEAANSSKQKDESDRNDDQDASTPSQQGTAEDNAATPDTPNKGKLLLDATCVPTDIRFPTDLSLLNEGREKIEKMIDNVWEYLKVCYRKKPRNYRKKARKDYLNKAKKPGKKGVRKAIGKQLNYLKRDLNILEDLTQEAEEKGFYDIYTEKELEQIAVIRLMYTQQQEMYDNNTHRVDNRIVSLWQYWTRPIVRGKAKAPVEFGIKLEISVVDGFTEIEKISWNNFNESQGLMDSVERYKAKYGCYPEAVLADKLYRNRKNLAYCKAHGIRLSGPKLGRPPKDQQLTKAYKKLEYTDSCERNAVEGKFGEAKRKYGLDRLTTKLKETSETIVGLTVFTLNLKLYYRRSLRFLFIFFILALFSLFLRFQTRNSSKDSLFAITC